LGIRFSFTSVRSSESIFGRISDKNASIVTRTSNGWRSLRLLPCCVIGVAVHVLCVVLIIHQLYLQFAGEKGIFFRKFQTLHLTLYITRRESSKVDNIIGKY
jgi:hypothetical protein